MSENHKNGYKTDTSYHFQIRITVSMSESKEMCKIAFRFQHPKFRVHPAPEVHDFAIRCMNFSSHFKHLMSYKAW